MSVKNDRKTKNDKANLPSLGIDVKFDDVEKLQEALESQIDIVLRLEEERLKLLKENRQQKQLIAEFGGKQEPKLLKNQEIQTLTQSDRRDQMVQTGEDKEQSKNALLEEAMNLVNKHATKLKCSTSNLQDSKRESNISKQSTINTKRQTNSSFLKENDSSQISNTPKISEKELMTQEIVKLTKESNGFKFQLRTLAESLKRLEKENFDLRKNCELKNESLEKSRKEVAELSKVLNSDRFKSIRTIESDLMKALSLNKALQEQIITKDRENREMQEDVKELQTMIERLSHDYQDENQSKREEEMIKAETTLKTQEKTIEELNQNLKFKEQQLKIKEESLKEMMIQNESLNEEVEYFKGMAKSSKGHLEKALGDLEFYKSKAAELQKLSPKVE